MGTMALVVIALSLFVLLLVGAQQVQIVESARTAARMVARGQTALEAQALVERTVPDSELEFEERGTDIAVTVARRVELLSWLPALTLHATAVTPVEAADEG